jgi:short-subunit dehydrogenase
VRVLQGKAALITGAASGIGRALTLRLASEGVRCWLLDRQAERLAQVVAEVAAAGGAAHALVCDLAQPAQVDEAARSLRDEHGGVDLLVNNAGIAYYGRTLDMRPDLFDELLRVNLLAPVQLTCALLPSLLSRGEAHVLNVASVCGLVGLGRVAAYSTSKFGLVGFSESLRAEYGRCGLGVTVLCPGLVDTRLFAEAPSERPEQPPKLPPPWLLAKPERIAAAAVRAIRRNRSLVVAPWYARGLYAVKRFAPGTLDFLHHFRRPGRRGAARPCELPAERQPLPETRAA